MQNPHKKVFLPAASKQEKIRIAMQNFLAIFTKVKRLCYGKFYNHRFTPLLPLDNAGR
jgi:hypothetical protein